MTNNPNFKVGVRVVWLCVSMLLLFSINNCAQTINDTLHEVKVTDKLPNHSTNDSKVNLYSPGEKVQTIDSITLQQYQLQTIANLLTQQASVFVKTYSFNSLATLNFRGASAAQSQVLWNGIPIQNAALGISDVSLLHTMLIDKVNIVYGSSSAMWGSGNVGGALLIENNPPKFTTQPTTSFNLLAGMGSYGQYQIGLQTTYSNKRLYMSARLFGQKAMNDFTYTNNGKEQQLSNSQLSGGAGLLNIAYKLNNINILNFYGWYQEDNRQVPPALFEISSVKNEKDKSIRFLMDWQRKTEHNKWYVKAAYMNDAMQYTDANIKLYSTNTTQQVYTEAGCEHEFNNKSKLLFFTPIHLSWMRLTDTTTKQQTKVALAAAYLHTYLNNKLKTSFNIRIENIDNHIVELYGVNTSFSITHYLSIRGNVQKTYRIPTLNELYYVPGGNDSLKPEQGWNGDFGYLLKTKINRHIMFSHDASFFSSMIYNWIIWYGGSIWTPHNIASVFSRGMETENKLVWQISNKSQWHLGLNTSYILATTETSHLANDGSISKQLPYSPRYSGQLNLGFAYRQLYFNYNHTYTGYRFITTDESEYLPDYNIGNLQLMYSTQIHHYPIQFNLQCNNIWNTSYQIIASRPMPSMNWLLGVRVGM